MGHPSMGHVSAIASAVVRVTVSSRTRRVDLVLPAAVPVAELLPELARSVGLLDAGAVHGGYRLVTQEGRQLAVELSLVAQGVEDGVVLTVAAGVDDEPPRVYDDVVEAVADAVERDLGPWQPAAARRTALVAAWLLLGLAAVALLLQDGVPAAVAAALLSLGLIGGAVVLSRVQHAPGAAAAVAWLAAAYAAVAGYLLGDPLTAAGGGAAVGGLVALVGLGEGRILVLPPLVVGAVVAAAGLVGRAVAVEAAVVLTVALVLVVVAGAAFPWLALGVTGATVDLEQVDAPAVAGDVRLAHEILVALSATVGLLLVLVAPLAVGLGVAGALVAVTSSVVVMLRGRHHHAAAEVMTALVSGTAGLASVAVAALWLHPGWRSATAAVLVVAGAALLVVTALRPRPSARRALLGDVAETVGLVCLPPLLVVATGVFAAIRG